MYLATLDGEDGYRPCIHLKTVCPLIQPFKRVSRNHLCMVRITMLKACPTSITPTYNLGLAWVQPNGILAWSNNATEEGFGGHHGAVAPL